MNRTEISLAGRKTIALGLVLSGGWVAGCATYQASQRQVSEAVQQWQRPKTVTNAPQSIDHQPVASSADHRETSAVQRYVLAALERNPAIQAAIANVESKLARIPQVTSLSDPILRLIVRPEPIQTAAGDVVFTLGISQKLPWFGKLDQAGLAAAAEVGMAIGQLNTTRLQVIADVERAYYRLYLTERSSELTATNRRLLEDLEQVVASQYRVGRAGQHDLLRVQTELSNLLNDEARLQRQRASAAAALNQLMDQPVMGPIEPTRTQTVQRLDQAAQELIALAGDANPELARLAQQIERDRHRIHLAELDYVPDVTLGVEWNKVDGRAAFQPPGAKRANINRASEVGDDNWALTIGFNLPIWVQRLEAAKRQARLDLERTRKRRRAEENLIGFRILDAWERVHTHQDTIVLLETTLIPQAQQTYEVSMTAYGAGSSDFLTVIDNWRNMLSFELMMHREVAGLETAFAELQRQVGLELVRSELLIQDHRNEEVDDDN